MANPVLVACPVNQWTKVATDVVTGQIWKKLKTRYQCTYRMTGDSAPTNLTDAEPIFIGTVVEEISASAGIDVYIYAQGNDGQVRVDI